MGQCKLWKNSRHFDKRIQKLYDKVDHILVPPDKKIVIMSDCHRADGNWNDNFADNEKIYFAALCDYYKKGFDYIELGDGDELWELKNYQKIIQKNSHIFWILSKFYKEGRMTMLYGNHDMVKKNPSYIEKNLSVYYDERENKECSLFPDILVKEALVLELEAVKTHPTLFLLHGFQGDTINDQLWKLARFLVRYLWKPLEVIGIKNPVSASDYYREPKDGVCLEHWAKKHQQKLIMGHTHRPVCPAKGYYFNSGSCVHPRCITALELLGEALTLIKWCIEPNCDNFLVVKREVLSVHYFGEEDGEQAGK